MPFISFDPDEMSGGGLATDFDGVLERIRFMAWDFPKEDGDRMDEFLLVCKGYIRPDDPEEIPGAQLNEDGVIEHYWSCGSQKTATIERHFVPSNDGETPVDLESEDPSDWEGVGFIKVEGGSRSSLAGGSNFAHFLKNAKELGMGDFSGDISVYDGTHAHWERVEVVRRGFNPRKRNEDEQDYRAENLVMTKILGKPGKKKAVSKKKASVKKKATSKGRAAKVSKSQTDAEASEVLSEWLVKLIGGAIADGDIDHFDQIPTFLLKNWKGRPEGVEAKVKNVTEFVQSDEFIQVEGAPWVMDEEGGLEIA